MGIENRIFNKDLLSKITTADEAAKLIKDGMIVGASGFTPCGYPKCVPLALAKRIKEGEKIRIGLYTGASVGVELDEALAEVNAISKRLPYQTGKIINKRINDGDMLYLDIHLSQSAQQLRYGFLGKMDVCIVEAVCIMENGGIVPSTSVGNTPTFIQEADKVIVEINTSQPMELVGMSDIFIPADPPVRHPIPITDVSQRIGTPYMPCDPRKIVAIVECDITDKTRPLGALDEESKAMASHLIDFLKSVYGNKLPPLQSGVGDVANAVMAGLVHSDFENLKCWTEVIQDSMLDLIDIGKLTAVSGTSLSPSPDGLKRFYDKIKEYRNKIVLRPQEISNNAEMARRLGVVAMNTALEVDIYGNSNSTHMFGTRMVNGIGGSGDFSRNAGLTVMLTPSVAKRGAISRVVPHVAHYDHTEHEIHVIVTEQGVADLRGLDPKEKVPVIIEKCAHPDYRDMLWDYYNRAKKEVGGHIPMLLDEAYSWHVRFNETGTMKM
ncbi:MAG: succinate CoA transferase [Deltaproteobacteria bacterium]|nr:succinate CoA transferase [Deltaproteobacteria bacterium]